MGRTLKSNDYVHLHNHSQFSLLDGLTKLPDLIDHVKKAGMTSVAVTDHGTLSGSIEFYKEALQHDIKPVIGIETYVATRKLTDKDPVKDKQRFHLILLAMNNVGYQNIMRLSTVANLEGYYYFPRIDREILQKYNEGIIVLSACMGSEIGDALKQDQYQRARDTASWYKEIFGDRYYLEVQDHGHPDNPLHSAEQEHVNESIIKLAKELDIQMVVTSDAHYLRHEDQEAHEVLLCVGTGSYLDEEKRMSLKDFPLHVTDPQEIISRWSDTIPEAILNTKLIADRCNVDIKLGGILIPQFPLPKGTSEKQHLHELVYKGLTMRYTDYESESESIDKQKNKLPKEVLTRVQYELSIIDNMGFNGYFLIIADFIIWGKEQGIVFGPGRGSAAGSIVAYALRITELDPLAYDLLFERFLNPDRVSMPDIDIDIQDTRRDEVIRYCVNKYGKNRVANIITFGRMAARNAVRDVSRVLKVPYSEADRLAKMIPPPVQGRHIPLKKSLVDNDDLKKEYNTNETAKRVFDLAVQLEGTIRSHGIHAAGVVIAPDDIVTYVPLEKAQKGVIATQYSMGPIEELGLLKMDFLGLSNLTIIKNTLRIIKKVYETDINIDVLPLNDQKAFTLLQKGDTTGVFQLESAGMKRYLKALKPTEFEDIIAMGALYRPGPLAAGLTDKFIARKNGKEEVSYDHELMKPALKDTYGVMVYQEQFMQIVRDMCGFTGGESDSLRKAVGKKKRDMMATMKEQVITGAEKKNVPREVAEKFWSDLEGFADYAFNKSHAACYGLIAYQTAYLKANYSDAFMAALMTSDYDDTDRLAIEMAECKQMGIEVLQPDINESFLEFAVVPNSKKIRFGLNAIKNIGTNAVKEIIEVRNKHGKFAKIEEFLSKVSNHFVNRKGLESLIKAGAFDELNNRSQLLENIDTLIGYSSKVQKEANTGQTGLFGANSEHTAPELRLAEPQNLFTQSEQLSWERELMGIYLSSHPLEDFETMFNDCCESFLDLANHSHDETVSVGGLLDSIKEITTKKGDKMAFVNLTDGLDTIEVIIFPGTFLKYADQLTKDNVVIIKGVVSKKSASGAQDALKIVAKQVKKVTQEDAKAYKPKKNKPKQNPNKKKEINSNSKSIYLRIADSSNSKLLIHIKKIVDEHPGSQSAVLVLGDNDSKQAVKLPQTVKITDVLHDHLKQLLGDDCVVVS